MKKRKKLTKQKKQRRSDPKIIFLLFGVPLLLILSLALLFSKSKLQDKGGAPAEQYPVEEYTESTSSGDTPEELLQAPDQSPVPPPFSTLTPEPLATATPTHTPTPTIRPTNTPVPTRTPTPTLAPCSLCQHQINLFWGPVVKSFTGGKSYSVPVNRLIASSSDSANKKWLPVCTLYPVSPVAISNPQVSVGCEDPVTKKYLSGSIDISHASLPDGYVKGVVTNSSSNCIYEVGLATYKAARIGNDSTQDTEKQNIYDYRMVPIKPQEIVEIYVRAPMQNDSPSCHKIPELTMIPVSTPTLTPTPVSPGYDITVRSEIVKTLWMANPRVKFSWAKIPDISSDVSNIYIRRWDNDPPTPGKQYKEYQIKPSITSFINSGLISNVNYYYKYCIELKNYNKLICTNIIEVQGGVEGEQKVKLVFPGDFERGVLGASTDKKDKEADEIFKERPGLLRLLVRWLVRGNK